GVDSDAAVLAESARGTLPPGVLGTPVIQEVLPIVEAVVEAADTPVAGTASPGSVDVQLTLLDGRTLGGTVPGVAGDVLRTVTSSRVSAKHRLAAWVRLLALTAAYPERPFQAITIGRGEAGAQVTIARIPPLAPDAAGRRKLSLSHLAAFLDLF